MTAAALPASPVAASPAVRRGLVFLLAFSSAAIGLGAARALTTAYVPVLLERIADKPGLIGAVMLVNAAAGFAVPLVAGVWSDRAGRRAPFIAGGLIVGAGGLVAIGLGNASSYAALALAAATVYVGLNAAATAHRSLVAERFEDGERPRITSAQEGAMLVGALFGTVAGGALVDSSPALLFGAAAVALLVAGAPTLLMRLVREPAPVVAAEAREPAEPLRAPLMRAIRTPGAREVLGAQVLWVFAYAALTPFMVLYADHVLGIGSAAAGGLLAAFGLLTGAGMVFAGRLEAERVRPVLLFGAALLGGGLLAALPASSVAVAALPFAAAAVGAGLVTALGFPYFARFIPSGEEGAYSGVFFAGRAVAAAAALPMAGGIVAVFGYRALLAQGGAALVALVPLARAQAAAAAEPRPAAPGRPALARVAAVVPIFHGDRVEEVTAGALRHVDLVLLVDDGAPPAVAARADALAGDRVEVLHLGRNGGKGAALAAGFAALARRPDAPDAIVTLDADGQHSPERIPAFVAAAAHADVVIGRRRARRAGGMPLLRRFSNAASSTALSIVARRRLPDAQNGMRLIRTDALRRVPLEPGRFEAETRHLKALARDGAVLAWVDIPTIYAGEPSAFRTLPDAARISREIVRGRRREALPGPSALVGVLRVWWPRLLLSVLAVMAVGAALPALQGTDEALFRGINGLGDGPEWLYQALDPHSRNYALLTLLAILAALTMHRRGRFAFGAALALVLAAFVSDAILEIFQITFDRPRPEEAIGAQAMLSHDRSWAHIPSFPSGHLMVTAAMVAAAAVIAPRLRGALTVYLVAVAITRMLFGAHFPLDVLVGGLLGWEVGLFSVALVRAAALLPAAQARERAAALPEAAQPVGVTR
jgi:membrane-associated phospholipid phosphatase/MFS family permease